jgi:hypothetical protein
VHLPPCFGNDRFAAYLLTTTKAVDERQDYLNQCHKFKSFVYDKVRFVRERGETFLEVVVVSRQNSKAICLQCTKPAGLYDRLDKSRFEFIPL